MSDESNVEKDKVWELLENSFGKRLIPIKGRNSWRTSPDSKVSIFLAYSKYYPEDTRYCMELERRIFKIGKIPKDFL
jgi:hypothetical protein